MMGEDAAREAFTTIKSYMERLKNNTKDVYDMEWSDTSFYGNASATPSGKGAGTTTAAQADSGGWKDL